MRPNFLVIGAPKAATTALCHNLAQHPDVFFSEPKEPFFFSDDAIHARGMAWYESLFAAAGTRTAIGEGSTTYSVNGVFPQTVGRIVEALPDVRVIYQLRDPLERMRSHWIELAAQGRTMLPFDRAVREEAEIVDASRYWRQLEAYRTHLADDRILVLFFEDYQRDAIATLQRCFNFLGVDPAVEIAGAAAPRHTSQGRRADRALTNWVRRRVPAFDRLRDAMPRPLRKLAKLALKQPIVGKPEWDPDTRAWALEQVRGDAARVLEFAGKPAHYWELA